MAREFLPTAVFVAAHAIPAAVFPSISPPTAAATIVALRLNDPVPENRMKRVV